MKQSLREIQLLLVRLSVALLSYPVCKILFFLFNHKYFQDVSVTDFISILFFGLRFDISALVLMNTPFILLHLIPFGFTRKKWYQLILKTVFIIVNSISILANCLDFEYYKYILKHTTIDFFKVFDLGSDMSTLMPQYLKDFWYVALLWISITVLIAFLYGKTKPFLQRFSQEKFTAPRTLSWLALSLAFIALCVIAFRGGLQLRPIETINASEYVAAKNIPLVINTPFAIIKSYGLEGLEEKKYFSNQELQKIFTPIHHETRNQKPETRSNVFIIILESFSKEYIGSLSGKKSYTPFLDSLMKESLVFDRAFANGKKSIEGIPAVLASIPSLMNEPYITSIYGSNKFSSLATTLKQKGYSSAFFHGGTNGTMAFDAFTKAAGFDNYYGRFEYNNEKDYDGEWGIPDEKFFQYAEKQTGKMKRPFLTALFSLSSHHPYKVPDEYKKDFPEGELPIHKSVMYSDFSLKQFFKTVQKEKWFDSTLFIITADHTGPSADNFYSNNVGTFSIPIIFYRHNSSLKGINSKTMQHINVMPTVLSYLNYNEPYFSMGENILDSTSKGWAINYINDVYQFFQDDYLLQFDGQNALALYNFKTDPLLQSNLLGKDSSATLRVTQKEMETKLKAVIQSFNHAMIHNEMTSKAE
ncbi:MAG: LTA synthase family protein [Bacteroidia bacterium]